MDISFNALGEVLKPVVRQVYVDGYKNLVDCQFNLHDINILVGPNNSGKSNFLEIFSFVKGLLFGSNDLRKDIFENASTFRGDSSVCLVSDHICKPISMSFTTELSGNDKRRRLVKYSFKIQCALSTAKPGKEDKKIGFLSEEIIIKDVAKTGKPTFLLKRKENTFEVRLKSGHFKKNIIDRRVSCIPTTATLYPGLNNLDTNCAIAFYSITNILNTDVISASAIGLRASLGRGGPNPFDQTIKLFNAFDLLPLIAHIHKKKALYNHFKSTLCQILDLEDAVFSVIPLPKELAESSKNASKESYFFGIKMPNVPLTAITNFSDGTLIVVAILTVILSPERSNELICIEEPENCLHPKALRTLISYLLQHKDNQILITTHSPYLLNLIRPEDVTIASIQKDGSTRFDRVKHLKEISRKLKSGFINFGDLLETDFED